MNDKTTLKSDIPEAYVTGKAFFCDLEFIVNENVLIPRIETENLVDIVVNYIKENKLENNTDLKILDIGTGSGCIAITLATKLSNIHVDAIDISPKALAVAKENAVKNRVGDRVKFIENNLLENITQHYDIIVSNLPYIPTKRIPILENSVKNFEPTLALDGGEDGFELYRKLFKQIIENNIKPDFIAIEFDDEHNEIAKIEANKYFNNHDIKVEKDLFKYDRFLTIQA
jgi:release factor glutamine methyltransferase